MSQCNTVVSLNTRRKFVYIPEDMAGALGSPVATQGDGDLEHGSESDSDTDDGSLIND